MDALLHVRFVCKLIIGQYFKSWLCRYFFSSASSKDMDLKFPASICLFICRFIRVEFAAFWRLQMVLVSFQKYRLIGENSFIHLYFYGLLQNSEILCCIAMNNAYCKNNLKLCNAVHLFVICLDICL